MYEGCGFVKFSSREDAVAAMNALHGNYVMRVNFLYFLNSAQVSQVGALLMMYLFSLCHQGCDQPLIVRFADPKRPRPAESRSLYIFRFRPSPYHFLLVILYSKKLADL